RLQCSACSCVFDDRPKGVSKGGFLERLWSKRVHRSARFTQAVAGQLASSSNMTNSMLWILLKERFFGSLHLNNHAREALGERVVNVSRHSGSLFKNGSLTLLFDKLLSMRGHHDVMRQCLRKLDLIGSIGAPF